ncbi:type A chloramphenicol O-acetyltransferase [Microbacterium sp. H1-D42]|uniref:type A chloramphenicol O-acetyltransferase n=1 Tax=Microbacterium sp. H1-D42 TaxID=2925844 RepID=UPI001F52F6BF|nr:type A chloramphenicol O-acetyltransferase [Microbacterium sp. H1-D42]UNK69292.1 type A chloramphenicol O-acetyltransferase [Microbacterium sp. H1-D42]
MHSPIPIDLSTWPRRQHFEHFFRDAPCSYSITVELDVTEFVEAVRSAGRRTYIAQIWALASVVNSHDEFRMTLTEAGAPAIWPHVHPSFTVFNEAQETFSSLWTPFDPDFATFHDSAAQVIAEHTGTTEFFPQGAPPRNSFDVSSLPWTSFTGFNLNIDGGGKHLAPIFTFGRYTESDGRVLLPLAVQIHHAAADGFHTARLVSELSELLRDGSWLGAQPDPLSSGE